MNRVMNRIVEFANSLGFQIDPANKERSSDVDVRWMIRRDMPSILEIEHDSFEFPWNEEEFIQCLRQRNCIGMVAEIRDQVVGFMVYQLHKDRLHLLNLAVHPNLRRAGIGRALIDKLIGKLATTPRTSVVVEVRETNIDAQLFFREFRFKAISVLQEHYFDTDEAAYVMEYRK